MSNPKISILVPAYKSERVVTNVLIHSWLKHSVPGLSELVIYDNGGNGDSLQKLRDALADTPHGLPKPIDVTIIGDGVNGGMNVPTNECAKMAKGDYYYWVHTDMYLMPGWDTALLNAAKNLPPASFLFCGRSIEPDKGHTEYHIIKNFGRHIDEFDEKGLLEFFKGYNDNTILTGYRMPFFCHKKLWEKMGGLDPHYICYASDDDLVQSAYHAGARKFWMVYNSVVYHLQGTSSKHASDKNQNEPYEYFIQKWRKLGYKDAAHPGQWQHRFIPWYVKVR